MCMLVVCRELPVGRRRREVYLDEAYLWQGESSLDSWYDPDDDLQGVQHLWSKGTRLTFIVDGDEKGYIPDGMHVEV
jgi:hypothetical protein